MSKKLKYFLNNFELYIATLFFVMITILLSLQIISRYVFKSSFTWTEEVSLILFVWMVYLAISAATLKRKHIRMDFLIEKLPFKFKKAALIFSNIMAILFFGYFLGPFCEVVFNLYQIKSVTAITGIPKLVTYGIIPLCMVLTIIRFFQDSIILLQEDEEHLGETKALLDLDNIKSSKEDIIL
ncbi:MAG: TRAP transporter small permease [Peptococcaceae bacterium]